MKVLLGIKFADEMAKKFISSCSQHGVTISDYAVALSKTAVEERLASDKSIDVLILSKSLGGKHYTLSELEKLTDIMGENTKLILIMHESDRNNKDFLSGLMSLGILDGVFDNDSRPSVIAGLIKESRDKVRAKTYYGVSSVYAANEDQVKNLANMSLGELKVFLNSQKDIVDSLSYIKSCVSDDVFIKLLSSLENEQREVVISDGRFKAVFDVLNASEPIDVASVVVDDVKSQKPKAAVVNTAKVDVGSVIAVVGLGRGSGSTFVSLNMAKVLVDCDVDVSLIQLPYTRGMMYERLNFKERFGASFISHFQKLKDNGFVPMAKRNMFEGINFIVENTLVDDISEWDFSDSCKLLLSLSGTKIVDFGATYKKADNFELLKTVKNIVVVIDDTLTFSVEDARALIELSRECGAELSFVVNKCHDSVSSEAVRFIGEDFKNVCLPEYADKVLAKSKTGILYPGDAATLSKLAELVGYELGNGKKKKEKKVKESYHEVSSPVTIEVGVAGVCRGVGVTHTAIMIASVLARRYSVAVVEQNNTGSFASFYRSMNRDSVSNECFVNKFTVAGVDYYPMCSYHNFVSACRDQYDYVIVDFGDDYKVDNYVRMSMKLMVGSSAAWKDMRLIRFVGDESVKIDPNKSIRYLIPFEDNDGVKPLRKLLKGCSIYPVPYSKVASKPGDDVSVVVNAIMGTNAKKKRFFK